MSVNNSLGFFQTILTLWIQPGKVLSLEHLYCRKKTHIMELFILCDILEIVHLFTQYVHDHMFQDYPSMCDTKNYRHIVPPCVPLCNRNRFRLRCDSDPPNSPVDTVRNSSPRIGQERNILWKNLYSLNERRYALKSQTYAFKFFISLFFLFNWYLYLAWL